MPSLESHTIRVHSFLDATQSNGPGRRAVLWVQGCSLGCPGCFNPETHHPHQGSQVSVADLAQKIQAVADSIEGITISGGEPLQQRQPLEALLDQIRSTTSLSVILFSGYTWEEINRMPKIDSLLANVDVLIAGRFLLEKRMAKSLIGSANKTVHFISDRYSRTDLEQTPPAEVWIGPNGEISLSGIDPLRWTK